MNYQHLIETTLQSQEVYHGKLLQVREDTVRLPDQSSARREYINHPGASCIVPILADQRLVLVRQYRYPIRKTMLELPAGKLSINESPRQSAERELEEETGYQAHTWLDLGACHPCIGYSNEVIYYFVARDLTEHLAHPDEGEFVETVVLPLSTVWAMVQAGEITDSKTLSGLLLARLQGLIC